MTVCIAEKENVITTEGIDAFYRTFNDFLKSQQEATGWSFVVMPSSLLVKTGQRNTQKNREKRKAA